MAKQYPDRRQILQMSESFMAACVVGAAAELDLFSLLAGKPATAEEVTGMVDGDLRCTEALLNAAVSLDLLDKENGVYSTPEPLAAFLTEDGEGNRSAHAAAPNEHPSQLEPTGLDGKGRRAFSATSQRPGPCGRPRVLRGRHALRVRTYMRRRDRNLGPPSFSHLLDVGGASGTWTMALLRAVPGSRATLFDLPDAVQQARERIGQTEFHDRVTFAAGDFYRDELPAGADLAWVSAIVHQHGRQQNRELFQKIYAALTPGGTIAIRDMVMNEDHTRPTSGALFAINMIVNTDTGGTFSFEELAEDLQAAGFTNSQLAVKTEDMSSIVTATK